MPSLFFTCTHTDSLVQVFTEDLVFFQLFFNFFFAAVFFKLFQNDFLYHDYKKKYYYKKVYLQFEKKPLDDHDEKLDRIWYKIK